MKMQSNKQEKANTFRDQLSTLASSSMATPGETSLPLGGRESELLIVLKLLVRELMLCRLSGLDEGACSVLVLNERESRARGEVTERGDMTPPGCDEERGSNSILMTLRIAPSQLCTYWGEGDDI